ncbi:hypothetical protein PHYPSEUDO_002291 [Phytophthora pseudosyringae]|uniref:Uncharacterized protein n=1 Tax=Phytophthora pseudosyringae TaxID=221518 RepID=A0A8T1WEC4_9STRA|nr:hypothetical protein PHYPSEUDO_002291 [Phytophthora pseudosyringae]
MPNRDLAHLSRAHEVLGDSFVHSPSFSVSLGPTYKTKSTIPRRASGNRQSARYRVEAVLVELQERRNEREQDLNQYSNAPLHEVENEDTDTPIMDPFRDLGGPDAIKDMTNFSLREFNELWLTVRDPVRMNYNVGRGR